MLSALATSLLLSHCAGAGETNMQYCYGNRKTSTSRGRLASSLESDERPRLGQPTQCSHASKRRPSRQPAPIHSNLHSGSGYDGRGTFSQFVLYQTIIVAGIIVYATGSTGPVTGRRGAGALRGTGGSTATRRAPRMMVSVNWRTYKPRAGRSGGYRVWNAVIAS